MLRCTLVTMIGQLIRSLNLARRSCGSWMLSMSQQHSHSPPSPSTQPSTCIISSHSAKRPAYYSSAALSTRLPSLPPSHRSGRPADLIVNCTGLRSLKLSGVEDKDLHPARAQVLVVKEPFEQVDGSARCEWYRQCRYVLVRHNDLQPMISSFRQMGSRAQPRARKAQYAAVRRAQPNSYE